MELITITHQVCYEQTIRAIYDEAFPKEEQVPASLLLPFFASRGCETFLIREDDQDAGFITLMLQKDLRIGYIWFFAVGKHFQNQGLGGGVLRLIASIYSDYQLVLDIEKPDVHLPGNIQRLRRRNFYLRNGYHPTGMGMSYLDVDYEILCSAPEFEPVRFKKLLDRIQIKDFDPVMFTI